MPPTRALIFLVLAAGAAALCPASVLSARRSPARPRAAVVAGVAGLQTWMRKRFRSSFEPVASAEIGEVDCIYVDVNELIHLAVRRASSNDDLIRQVLRRVSELLRATPPRRLAVFAMDGPGPLAKVLTQRQRRRKTAAKAERQEGAGGRSQGVDTLALSPGTPFMLELSDALEAFAQRRASIAGTRILTAEKHLGYVVSGAHVAGEGEVKCVEHMLEVAATSPAGDCGTHVLHGSDSDLLLLALAAGVEGVSVAAPVRSAGPRTGKPAVRYEVFSADACRARLHELLPLDGPTGRRELDLVCLAVLSSGNDYMPALQMVNLESAFAAYCDLANGGEGGSAPAEALHLVRVEKDRDGRAVRALIERRQLARLLVALSDIRTLRAPPNAPSAVPVLTLAAAAPLDELHAAEEYVRAAEWVLSQYVTGRCPDFGLVTCSTPTVHGLIALLSEPPVCADAAVVAARPPRAALARPPIPAVYNLLVQPPAGKAVVPPPLRFLMDASSPIGWLYHQGSTCAECARLYNEMLPFMREAQLLAPRRDDDAEALARFEAVQVELKALAKKERAHLDACHNGKRLMHNELPAVETVEALVAGARLQDMTAQERRTLALAEAVRIKPGQGEWPGGSPGPALPKPRSWGARAGAGAPSGAIASGTGRQPVSRGAASVSAGARQQRARAPELRQPPPAQPRGKGAPAAGRAAATRPAAGAVSVAAANQPTGGAGRRSPAPRRAASASLDSAAVDPPPKQANA